MEGEIITLQDLFRFHQTGVTEDGQILGGIAATGIRPGFAEKFETSGIILPEHMFLAGVGTHLGNK
jgi:pilus assembly protein CpaF